MVVWGVPKTPLKVDGRAEGGRQLRKVTMRRISISATARSKPRGRSIIELKGRKYKE